MSRSQRRRAPIPPERRAEQAIEDVLAGGDSLGAWTAVWDVVQGGDAHAKQALLDHLEQRLATLGPAETDTIRPYVAVVATSLRGRPPERTLLPSAEVRRQGRQDLIDASRREMERLGVRPGDGIPMWALYMTRRSKRSFG